MNSIPDKFSEARDIYTVSRLNREVRSVLETGFPLLWIEAELSNFSRPASGHWYFSLKDEAAQVKCAMFRNRNQLVQVTPENGKQILVRARIGLYEARGDYQLIVEHMEEAGDGALRRQFDLLKQKLADEGLFDSANKKQIPKQISRVSIITSASGAAIHDILTTLKRRAPMQQITIYPVSVQGKGASKKITSAINKINKRNDSDVIIVARGGGSLEDLWEFNEEEVARAIYKSVIPIVTGIGHEVDFTIADFVADFRAATPTAAAELISPDRLQQLQHLLSQQTRLTYLIQQIIQQKQQRVDWLSKRLSHPRERLELLNNRLHSLNQRNLRAIQNKLISSQSTLKLCEAQLTKNNPSQRVQHLKLRFGNINKRISMLSSQLISAKKQKLHHLVQTLDTLSPLQTIRRGFAIVEDDENNIIRNTSKLKMDQKIKTQVDQGHFFSTIIEIHNEKK